MRRLVVLRLLLGTATWPGEFVIMLGDNLYGSQNLADKFEPFLAREPRRLDMFADPRDDDAIHHFEHEWNEAVQVMLLFFGLVNAGVPLPWHGTGTWAMLTAALVGRPLGIMAAIWIALAAGLHLPPILDEIKLGALSTILGAVAAIGFARVLKVGRFARRTHGREDLWPTA